MIQPREGHDPTKEIWGCSKGISTWLGRVIKVEKYERTVMVELLTSIDK